jgi:hypothetical protein
MKQKGLLKLFGCLMVAALLMTGCMRINPARTFAYGLVDLLMLPFEELNDEEYSKDLAGEVQELINTTSHDASFSFRIKDVFADGMGFDTSMLRGGKLDIESMYDAQTGDMSMAVNGLGLVNGYLYMQENQFAVDVPQFLTSMIVYEMQSQLNYNQPIMLNDRMTDLQYAINPEAGAIDQAFLDEMKTIMRHYARLIADNLDISKLAWTTENVSVMGKSTRAQVITVSFDENDLRDLTEIVLERAQDDERLKDFVVNNFMAAAYDDIRDAEDEFDDAIAYALEDIDYAFEGEDIDLAVSIYFTPSFLMSGTPLAVGISVDDGWQEVDLFYKFVVDEREMDVAVTAEADGETIDFSLTNLKTRGGYTMEGSFNIPSEGVRVTIDGTTAISRDAEVTDMTINLSGSDLDMDGTVKIWSELTRIRNKREYEVVSEIEGSINAYGETMGIVVDASGTYKFDNSVRVSVPDLDGSNAIRVDNIEDLVNEIQNAMFFGFGF